MNILGLSPKHVFSGFENSFFDAICQLENIVLERYKVESLLFYLWSIAISTDINKNKWATKKDRHYHASINAFNIKSKIAGSIIDKNQNMDLIYQIGGLWNPLIYSDNKLPLFIQVDYTTQLSKRSSGEWSRRPGYESDFWIDAEKKLYNDSIKILTTTDNARRSIVEDYGVPESKVITVGCGVSYPYDNIEPDRFPDYSAKKILFIGRGIKGKGLDVLLDSFREIKKSIPDVTLTVIGPKSLGHLPDGVNYLGRIMNKDFVKEQYYQHSIFVMPSINEPLGQVFLEAMSCKLPCIGTTMDAMPQIITHGETGYLIEKGDKEKLTDYLTNCLEKPDLLRKMGQAGFEKLCTDWTWPQVAKKVYEIFLKYQN